MMNDPHLEPVVCPQCSELVIACALGPTVAVPRHPDLSWPQRDCDASFRIIAAPRILL